MVGNSKNTTVQHQNTSTQSRDIKNIKIHQPKIELQERIKNPERERERQHIFTFFFSSRREYERV